MLKVKFDDFEIVNLIEGVAVGMVVIVEKMGFDVLEDWEVDEFLDWIISFNFEE